MRVRARTGAGGTGFGLSELREMHRRCNYNAEAIKEVQRAIEMERLERETGAARDEFTINPKVLYYKDQYQRSGLASAVILPYLDAETVQCLSDAHLEALDEIAAFQTAAARWSSVITADLPDLDLVVSVLVDPARVARELQQQRLLGGRLVLHVVRLFERIDHAHEHFVDRAAEVPGYEADWDADHEGHATGDGGEGLLHPQRLALAGLLPDRGRRRAGHLLVGVGQGFQRAVERVRTAGLERHHERLAAGVLHGVGELEDPAV